MRVSKSALLLCIIALCAQPALACGEGVFQMGEGLRYQGYLAPRPGAILVYEADGRPPEERIRVYRGLVQAGHSLTVASTPAALAEALRRERYDVVIASADVLATVSAAGSASPAMPRVLPVVQRSQRDTFAQQDFVLDGASVGQYLRVINRLIRS